MSGQTLVDGKRIDRASRARGVIRLSNAERLEYARWTWVVPGWPRGYCPLHDKSEECWSECWPARLEFRAVALALARYWEDSAAA
ncbi:MAG TPA: hypothetical protein VKG20_20640 [Methylomirabilota bacterium]|nr:hypothetical protein [Methylomirabilota bacterium]